MFRVRLLWVFGILLVLAVPGAIPASGEEWKIEYTAEGFPESQGPWARGIAYGGGVRTLKDGIFTLDTLANVQISDYYRVSLPVGADPGPGELLELDWVLHVEKTIGPSGAHLAVTGDYGRVISFRHGTDRVTSPIFDPTLDLFVEPGRFHAYRMQTADMLTYYLWVDNVLSHVGQMWQGGPGFYVAWGEGGSAEAGLSHWDYLACGVNRRDLKGDLDCNGRIDFGDISPFVLLLSDPVEYKRQQPVCDETNGDINNDGRADFGDINGFVDLLTRKL